MQRIRKGTGRNNFLLSGSTLNSTFLSVIFMILWLPREMLNVPDTATEGRRRKTDIPSTVIIHFITSHGAFILSRP